MPRDYYINGEVMVKVRSGANPIGTAGRLLGLCSDSITITPNFRHLDIQPDVWGGDQGPPNDVQWMLADVMISMRLIHFDPTVLSYCVRHSMGARDGAEGIMARAGTRLGGGGALSASSNALINLNLTGPVGGGTNNLWYFPATYLTGPPFTFPIGVERSIVELNWRAIPYQADPAGTVDSLGRGTGAQDLYLWDRSTNFTAS